MNLTGKATFWRLLCHTNGISGLWLRRLRHRKVVRKDLLSVMADWELTTSPRPGAAPTTEDWQLTDAEELRLLVDLSSTLRQPAGQEKVRRILLKLSGSLEIQPPLSFEKLLQAVGYSAALTYSQNDHTQPLRVGRQSSPQERESWLAALTQLATLINNRDLQEAVGQYAATARPLPPALARRLSLNSLACDIAAQLSYLLLHPALAEADKTPTPDLNLLPAGEKLAESLDALLWVLNVAQTAQASATAAEAEKYRTSHTTTESLLQKEHLAVASSTSYQAAREAMALKKFTQDAESPYPTCYFEKSAAAGRIQLKPLIEAYGEKMQELVLDVWRKCEGLSDLHADVLDALCAIWVKQATATHTKAIVTLDDILRLRGLTPHLSGDGRRGGFSQEQRTSVLEAISALETLWFEVTETFFGRKGPRKNFVQSRALVVTEAGGNDQDPRHTEIEWIVFQPGEIFANYLMSEGRQTALLAGKTLRYNTIYKAVEKRLARYLSWQWRIRARRANYAQPYQVQTLLREAGIEVGPRNQQRLHERLEAALDCLQEDKIIETWQYLNWDWGTAPTCWLEPWLATQIVILPPSVVEDSYLPIAHTPKLLKQIRHKQPIIDVPSSAAPPPHPKPRATQPPARSTAPAMSRAELAAAVKQHRQKLGLTQTELAQKLKISQPSLARVEKGTPVSAAMTQVVRQWLNSE